MMILLTLLWSCLALASEKMEVTLKSVVQLGSSQNLLLEDLVLSPKAVPSELLEIPFEMTGDRLSKTQLLEWFKTKRMDVRELNQFTFQIPEAIQMEKTEDGYSQIFKQRLYSRLKTKCTDCDFKIKMTHVPAISDNKSRIDYRQLPISGPFLLSVYNIEGDKSAWLSGQIQTFRTIVRTARFLKSGETLQESDLAQEVSDISFVKDYYTKISDLKGRKLNRALAARTLLTSQDIERNLDIRQGQTVKARSGTPNFEVVIQAVALDSGAVGDVIRIRNPNYQKMLSARVIEPGVVEIQ